MLQNKTTIFFGNSNTEFEYTKNVVDVAFNVIKEDGLYRFMDKHDK